MKKILKTMALLTLTVAMAPIYPAEQTNANEHYNALTEEKTDQSTRNGTNLTPDRLTKAKAWAIACAILAAPITSIPLSGFAVGKLTALSYNVGSIASGCIGIGSVIAVTIISDQLLRRVAGKELYEMALDIMNQYPVELTVGSGVASSAVVATIALACLGNSK